MPLLSLSPELVLAIASNLTMDSAALRALCLAGNHNLLTLVRPLTWKELRLVLGDNSVSGPALAARLEAFFADPAKAGAVRYLDITLKGRYISVIPAVKAVLNGMKRLVNTTHVKICCVRSQNLPRWPTSGRLVRHAVECIPSLLSIRVDGCNANIAQEFFDMEEVREETDPPTPPPKLIHVDARFCNPILSGLWVNCPNIRIFETEGGHPQEFWRAKIAEDDEEDNTVEPVYHGTVDDWTCIADMLDEDVNNNIEVINIKSHAALDDANYETEYIANRFTDADDPPPARLKVFSAQIALSVEQYRQIIRGIGRPAVEQFAVLFSQEDVWVASVFDELLRELKNADGGVPFFAGFASLAEYWIPCDGVSVPTMDLLLDLLSHAPQLKHLFFNTASDLGELPDAARKYAQSITTLVSISWCNQATFMVKRSVLEVDVEVAQGKYMLPKWTEPRGIGEWWEM
ncbi:hypothetical protein C8R46DRAFT_1077357 [Mycena filopes]|nr:hypothetical protein C8R46DRAFT_1077357 [Mycena filopes]